MADSDRPAVRGVAHAALEDELNENALREMRLAVRVAESESNRWAAFSLVEVEWISTVISPRSSASPSPADELPEQANAELERRAIASARCDDA
jgi:hypothetical protein